MRAVPAELDAAVVAEIDARLARVEADHGVRIPWAIESGSRAWGFPSPELLEESSTPAAVRAAVAELIAVTAMTRELGAGEPPAVLRDFVERELTRAEPFDRETPAAELHVARAAADRWFRAELARS